MAASRPGLVTLLWGLSLALVLVQVLAQDPDQSQGCAQGSCYPATGDLLVGREKNLHASSTCGMKKKESYCIVSHLQDEKKCFFCDSRRPYDPVYNTINHRIENVITTFKPHRRKSWWQSENGKSDVFIQLDLEAEFHFTHLIMTFKTFRPAAMLIERSSDFGRTWSVYRYFAHDCEAAFPGISHNPLLHVDDVICESRYSDIEPSTEGEVIFRVLDPAIKIDDPYSPRIQNQLRITNLRLNFTKLHTLGDNLLDPRAEIKEKYYYSIYELVVRGNCFCYGHASECAPIQGIRDQDGMVHGRCVCNHHTKGLNCEQCDDFYNDLPWRPAEGRNTHACKKCECHGHSSSCHFDMAVFLATGNSSGGVCDQCLHNTMGRHCETCRPFYYKDPHRDLRDPQVCKPCDCDPDGSLDGGLCDALTDPALGQVSGQCRCKRQVQGPRCDSCKDGFYGLSSENPDGCQPCMCDPRGSVSGRQCDPVSGDCFCKRLVTGRSCDTCLPEHWALSHDASGCRGCDCDVGGALDNVCSADSGQCRCRGNMVGRQCSQVESGFFFMALDHLLYEAEVSRLGPGCSVEVRQHQPGRPASWTGLGFARVPVSSTLEFTIDNIPFSMEYDLLLRYESQMPRDWEEVRVSVIRPGAIPTSSPCGNTIPDDDRLLLSLPATARFMVPLKPVCLEKGVSYTLRFEFRRYQDFNSVTDGDAHFILVDSVALMPRHSSLDMFTSGDSGATLRKQTYERYRCHDTARSVTRPVMSEACARLISSMSAIINDGALECQCDPQGALSSLCDVRGGQCHCRQNVIGRRCDQCAPGTYGFGPNGCKECSCSLEGALSPLCDVSGQCACRSGAFGPRCDRCQSGHWGFPNCRPCLCNGNAAECHQMTGVCQDCRGNTGGDHCDRCADGFYGNPVLGQGGQCRPCLCPEGPHSGRHFAASCYQDDRTRQITCNCKQGYTGPRCDQCAPGHYGNPGAPGGRCEPCQCHNNIDVSDPAACDRSTGQCLRCLYHTEGQSCSVCQSGYYGDASRRNCRKCTCNSLGSDSTSCGQGGDCSCDRSSGQCQCLPHVTGLSCDHCAPNHWNLASGRGCQACDCDPGNSFSPACNEFTGQCQCRSGFGGKTCTDCQENYWGDPRTQCRVCDCEWQGIQSSQCERRTGHCVCRVGVSGVRCDQCARGFSGTFPNCVPCHQCFGDWDRIVQDLAVRTKSLSARAHELQTTGLTGPYEKAFKDLEEKLSKAMAIVQARNQTSAAVTVLMELIEELRTQISVATDWLSRVEAELTVVQDTNTEMSSDLSALERKARELNLTSGQLHRQMDLLKNSNFLGAYDSIRSSYNKSHDAERRANHSTITKPSVVSQSADTRRQTERLISTKKDDFNRKNAANKRALTDLTSRTQGLDMKKINEKVCGSPGDAPCGEGPCGGAGCRDDEGNRFCGGLNCEGAAAKAENALERSKHAEKQLQQAMRDVEELFSQVEEAKSRAEEARGKAQAALDKASATKRNVARSNDQLRDLIKEIRDFLTQDGAEPENIEAVANRVLELSIPASTLQIRQLADEITERVRSLSNVDAILEQTQKDVRRAEILLLDAKRARHDAEGVKTTAEAVKQALSDAQTAQTTAEKAINRARADIQETEGRLTQISSHTSSSEQVLQEVLGRLGVLGEEINDLKTKRARNSMEAARAEETATSARDKANEAKQILEGQLTDKYHEVQQRVDTKAKAVLEAKRRAESLREEAKTLLQDAQAKLSRLAELEQSYEENQKKLEGKSRQLDGLEEKMKTILQEINKQIQIYNTCQ